MPTNMFVLILTAVLAFVSSNPARRNPMINEGLFEGDMLGVDSSVDRNAVPYDSQLWPNGIVPYYFDGSLNEIKDMIFDAMKAIEDSSCIQFVPWKGQKDYVMMYKGSGCFAHWGRATGSQQLSLGDGCGFSGTIVHELLHAIGFEHEHNRSDRDDYLDIIWENIEEEWYYAFKKLHEDRLLTPFDYESIMLYAPTAFGKEYGLITMKAKDGRALRGNDEREAMSASDIRRINILYKCPEKN